jgi:hypothetical protein
MGSREIKHHLVWSLNTADLGWCLATSHQRAAPGRPPGSRKEETAESQTRICRAGGRPRSKAITNSLLRSQPTPAYILLQPTANSSLQPTTAYSLLQPKTYSGPQTTPVYDQLDNDQPTPAHTLIPPTTFSSLQPTPDQILLVWLY